MHSIYRDSLLQRCTPEGLHKDLESNDPKFAQAKAEFNTHRKESGIIQPHPANAELRIRKNQYESIKKSLSITCTNKVIDGILYNLIDQKINNWLALSDYMDSLNLTTDNPNPEISQACKELYTCGLTKGLDSNHVQFFKMPSKIDSLAYLPERKLLSSLAKQLIAHPEKYASIENIVKNLREGLSNKENALDYLKLAHAQGNSLLAASCNQKILELADYTQPLSRHAQQEIQQKAISFIAENIECKEELIINFISRIDDAYRAMLSGDSRGQFYLERALLTSQNLTVLSQKFDAQIEQFQGIQHEAIVAHVQESKNITRVLLKDGAQFVLKKYDMLPVIKEFMLSRGLDPKNYEKVFGNQLKHAIHTNLLNQIAKQHKLSGLQLIETSHLNNLLNFTIQITDLTREHNTAGKIEQASMLSSFCWQTLHYIEKAGSYGIDTIVGVGQGTLQGALRCAHTLTHPLELAENLGNLGLIYLKVLLASDLLDEMSILKSYEENLRIEQQYRQEYAPIFNAIGNTIREKLAEATYKDVVREATAFLVDTSLTNKTLSKLGEFAKIGALHSVEIIKNSPAAHAALEGEGLALRAFENAVSPQTIATTTEGIEIQAGRAAENCLFTEVKQPVNAAKIPDVRKMAFFSPEAVEEGVKIATTEMKIEHIFNKPKHNLGPLLKEFNHNYEDVVRAILKAADGKLPSSGFFKDVIIQVGTHNIHVRGVVIDGIPNLGTFFIK